MHSMSQHALGRTVQRLVAIEDLYHLALLSVPLARDVRADFASWESRGGSPHGSVARGRFGRRETVGARLLSRARG
ncbi:MAG: DUF3422 family protein [Chthoniobacterales bacterium]|nr:DUF3422 family protein [Chthoniobacterales bacterium]